MAQEESNKNTEEKPSAGTQPPAEASSEENLQPAGTAVPATGEENPVPATGDEATAGEGGEAQQGESVPAAADDEKPRKKAGWRKWLKRAALVLAALIVLVILVVAFCLGPITRCCVNKWGAEILGVDKCRIGVAKIYPFAGYVHFENIEIGKPVGKDYAFSRDLFSAGLIDVDVDVFSLLTSKIVFDHFEMRKIDVCYEQPVSGPSNVDALIKNLGGNETVAELEKEEEAARAAAANAPAAEEKEIFIGARYFVIENVSVSSVMSGVPMGFPTMSCNFPEGLGMDEDLSPTAFGMRVSGNFVSVFDFVQNSIVGDAAGAAADAVGDAATATGEAAGAAVDAVSGAAGSVVDVFLGESDDEEESSPEKKGQ